jgi:hypothetical protein
LNAELDCVLNVRNQQHAVSVFSSDGQARLEPKEASMTEQRKTDPQYSDPRSIAELRQGDRISASVTKKIDNPEFWRLCADEVRNIIGGMNLDETRAIMTRIAGDYEGIAKLVEQRLHERK